MEGPSNFAAHSPTHIVKTLARMPQDGDASSSKGASLVLGEVLAHCAVHIVHGLTDATVPHTSSEAFCTELNEAGVSAVAYFPDRADHMDVLLAMMSDWDGGVLSNPDVRKEMRARVRLFV
jgi:hypothetical protein